MITHNMNRKIAVIVQLNITILLLQTQTGRKPLDHGSLGVRPNDLAQHTDPRLRSARWLEASQIQAWFHHRTSSDLQLEETAIRTLMFPVQGGDDSAQFPTSKFITLYFPSARHKSV